MLMKKFVTYIFKLTDILKKNEEDFEKLIIEVT